MKNLTPSRRWLILPPVLLGLVVVALLANSKKELKRVDAEERAKPLRVVRVERQPVPAEATGYGTARPRRTWSAIAEVGGRIIETHPNLRSGIAVSAGESLLVIDPTDYQLRSQQRSADLAQAKAQLEQLELQQKADEYSLAIQQDLLAVREGEVERLKSLSTRSAASETEFDLVRASLLQQSQTVQTLENSLSTYPAQMAAAKAAISLAEARVKEAQRDIDRTKLVAPFDGLLSGVSLEPGQYVSPGQALFQVVDTGQVEIEAQFSISQLKRIMNSQMESLSVPATEQIGEPTVVRDGTMSTEVIALAEGSRTLQRLKWTAVVTARSGDVAMRFAGRPVRFSESLDEQTRTLGIVVRVDNLAGNHGGAHLSLRPGSYCEVKLTAEDPTEAFLVPRTSVIADSVFIVDEQDRLRRRDVQVAFPLRETFAVASGLADGDLVVVHPPVVMIEGELAEPILTKPSPSGSSSSAPATAMSRSEVTK